MASATATLAPGSLQLRWAFKCGNCRRSPPIVVCCRMRKPDRPTRILCVAGNGERLPNGGSWVGSASASESFSGWSDSSNGEDSLELKRKNELGGIVGAGVAGIVLVAGLAYATLSLSKQKTSRPKQQMEPLTTQQEEFLTSDDQMDTVDEDRTEDHRVDDVDTMQGNKDFVEKESNSSVENPKQATGNKPGDDIGNEILSVQKDDGTSNSSDQYNDTSVREELQYESDVVDNSVIPDTGLDSHVSPNIESAIDPLASQGLVSANVGLAAGIAESTFVPDNNLMDVESKASFVSLNSSTDYGEGIPDLTNKEGSSFQLGSSSSSFTNKPNDAMLLDTEPSSVNGDGKEHIDSASAKEDRFQIIMPQVPVNSSLGVHNLEKELAYTLPGAHARNDHSEISTDIPYSESAKPQSPFSSAGIPAPSGLFAAQQVLPGKVLVPAVVDQFQGQALAALQVMKVIEADVQPSDLCTRREYARWLVSASNALSRNSISKVYPAMYIENVTDLAFDDITPEDPDFTSIQGLAEAGLISSKLSRRDLLDEDDSPFYFSPESPLSRQDLVSWKMALEKRQLPEANREILYQGSGFIDVDRINPDACPALLADLSAGEQGIIAHAFGYTKLFQPDKPVTKAQVAIALATGEASDIVSEELARIEAESMAEKAVAAHNALVAEVEKDINAGFQKELSMEREKIEAVEKMAEEARHELERLKAKREEENNALMKERAALDSEMELLSRLRREVEEQLESLMSNKVEVAYEKEQVIKLRKNAETENQEIARLQYELEVERKALSMARAWAEDEARRASEQAKALEEARDRWERYGIKVVVDDKLREETATGVTWVNAGKEFSVEETVDRGEKLVDKLKAMAADVRGKSRLVIDTIIQKIKSLISDLKEWISKAGKNAAEVRDAAISRTSKLTQELQQNTDQIGSAIKEGAKRVAGDCREGIERLTQKFKT